MSLSKRNIIKGLFIWGLSILSVGALLQACSDEMDIPAAVNPGLTGEPGYITLELTTGKNVTRADEDATEPGIDALNENKINSVTLCLSPVAGDRTDEDVPAYMETFSDLNANGTAYLRIPLTMELITRLFGEGNVNENNDPECRVFAAVNIDPGNATTIAQIRDMVVESTFKTKQKQDGFTMDSDGTITYDRSQNYAIGKIIARRSAAKITLALDVDSEVEEVVNGEKLKWTPDYDGMRVRLQQGVCRSNLDPVAQPNRPYVIPSWQTDSDIPSDVSSAYFNTADDLAYLYNFVEDTEAEKYNRVQSVPFYTYPNKWTGSLEERHGTFLMLSVPWSPDGGTTWRTCYYHVPIIPYNQFELVRNNSYHVNLHVGVLGSFVPEEPLEVEADYYVADWGETYLEVAIKDYRYLVVDQNEYVVNNENTYSVPFYTSHPTEVISCTMTYYRFNFSDQGSKFEVTVSKSQNENEHGEKVYDVDFDNATKQLNISHDLVIYTPYRENGAEVLLTRRANGTRANIDNKNDITAMLNTIIYYKKKVPEEAEFSAIKYVISVQHSDVANGQTSYDQNKDYIETITVWQYPGIYIDAVQNYCDNLENKKWTNATSGNTFINNNIVDNAKKYHFNPDEDFITTVTGTEKNTEKIRLIFNYRNWNNSIGLGFQEGGYYNWNPNLYLVTITQLSQELGEKYIIDDPRSYNINNDLSNNYGNYTVDGGTTTVFKDEYWYFTNRASGYKYAKFDSPQSTMPTIDGTEATLSYTIPGYVTAEALGESSKRTLKYYYPTREDESNKYTIAPKFRICSSYAGTAGYLTREMSRRRAAAYQEVGYPAGRWRMPTFGEVEYMMTLAAEEKIPRLFGTTSSGTWYYWCAQGAVAVPDANDKTGKVEIVTPPTDARPATTYYTLPLAPFSGDNFIGRTRFVYDEWYWGSETLEQSVAGVADTIRPIYKFTWGDKEKTNPEIPPTSEN